LDGANQCRAARGDGGWQGIGAKIVDEQAIQKRVA